MKACPNGHQLWESWTGTTGCLQKDCEHQRTTEPQEEVVRDPHGKLPPCGHPVYVGWGSRRGCRMDGCQHYLTGPDVTETRFENRI